MNTTCRCILVTLMIKFEVSNEYRTIYTDGWDSRMSDLYVNPFVYDFDSKNYQAWQDGWEDADIEIRIDDGNDEAKLV